VRFSVKFGYVQARSVAQIESLDVPLRTGIWNITYMRYFESRDKFYYAEGINLMRVIWGGHLHLDLAQMPDDPFSAGAALKEIIDEGKWYEVYDLLQAIVEANPEDDLVERYNHMLTKHLAGYRILDDEVTPLTDEQEIQEIEHALASAGKFEGARHSLRNAIRLYSRLENPDYANSIKESISAVESVAREMTGKSTLGPGLDQLRREMPDLHPGLIAAWKSMYGYTSDEDAIRHGGKRAPNVTQDLARYFLVSCSAFVNLLVGLRS
jgi:tetratricopeptide (TPR) repeat protein